MTKPLDVDRVDVSLTEDEDTIELELSAEQMSTLSKAAAANHPDPAPGRPAAEESLPKAPRSLQGKALQRHTWSNVPHGARIAVILSIVVASVALGGIAYLGTNRAPPPVPIISVADADAGSDWAAPEAPAAPPPADTEVVRFKNPFDATEVFEFPAGTSRAEAREAVAELLLQRARERKIPRRR